MAVGKVRGEIKDLQNNLSALCTGADRLNKDVVLKKREVFRKIINHMTIGMDMSPLFPKITMAANLTPNDMVLKKMMYLYVTTYAHKNPELALLTINLLQKDCQDQDPVVRGIALRSLCQLRVQNLLEYVAQPVTDGLSDSHPYVRKCAVIGVLKIYHLDQELIKNNGMLERVQQMLYSDSDPQVIGNTIHVVIQIAGASTLVNKKCLYHLLNHLNNLCEPAQCTVLELLSRYSPSDENEVYQLMNAIQDTLQHANSAILLGTIKAYMYLTLHLAAVHQQVLERIKEPIKTALSRNEPSTVYAVLAHVQLIISRAPVLFSMDAPSFYCRISDPTYIKRLKMDILASIADSNNAVQIVTELSEYVKDSNAAMGRHAVKCIGAVALNVQDVDGVIECLTVFLSSQNPHVAAEALLMLILLLRKFPDIAHVYLDTLASLQQPPTNEQHARSAYIWMIGRYADRIANAPYMLESFVETWSQEAPCVKLALLTAAAQAFLKRPPECQALLGGMLCAALCDTNIHIDVRDRALLYTRLLQAGTQHASSVISCDIPHIPAYTNHGQQDLADTLFEEFNSLSVLLQQPASQYLDKEHLATYHSYPQQGLGGGLGSTQHTNHETDTTIIHDTQANLLDLDDNDADDDNGHLNSAENQSAYASASLLDLDDLLGSSLTNSTSNNNNYMIQQSIDLYSHVNISPKDYMDMWGSGVVIGSISIDVPPATINKLESDQLAGIVQHVLQDKLQTIASGGSRPLYKLYLVAQSASCTYMVEVLVHTMQNSINVLIKAQGNAAVAEQQQFLPYVEQSLKAYLN